MLLSCSCGHCGGTFGHHPTQCQLHDALLRHVRNVMLKTVGLEVFLWLRDEGKHSDALCLTEPEPMHLGKSFAPRHIDTGCSGLRARVSCCGVGSSSCAFSTSDVEPSQVSPCPQWRGVGAESHYGHVGRFFLADHSQHFRVMTAMQETERAVFKQHCVPVVFRVYCGHV